METFEYLESPRLIFHRPRLCDAEEIFTRYASNKEVTRYVGFKCHQTIDDTKEFIAVSDTQWEKWRSGPYLIRLRDDNSLIGGTGFTFETRHRIMTGYVLAIDAWGKGYATESLNKMIETGRAMQLKRLYAICHVEHQLSQRVLEKCKFVREGLLKSYAEFPNLSPGKLFDVYRYAYVIR